MKIYNGKKENPAWSQAPDGVYRRRGSSAPQDFARRISVECVFDFSANLGEMKAKRVLEHVEIMLANRRVDRQVFKDFPGPSFGNEVNCVRCRQPGPEQVALKVKKRHLPEIGAPSFWNRIG